MIDYKISYKLGNMLHQYIIEAENENNAKYKALKNIPKTSQNILRDLKIERYYPEWN